jgi:hypothetical protein
MNNLNELAKQFHERAKAKGFWDEQREIGTLLMLMVSELSEALEADRKGQYAKIDDPQFIIDGKTIREDLDLATKENDMVKFEDIFRTQVKDTFEDEMADVFIRLFDFIGQRNIDIEKHVEFKMLYNQLRAYKHGKAY